MCDTCGCKLRSTHPSMRGEHARLAHSENGAATLTVLQGLLHENDRQAAHNREHFDRYGVLAINLMSAPGSGKTSLLEATIDASAGELNIAVIEGDLETENDAARIRAKGVPAVQITTGSACHLDAHLVHEALHRLDLSNVDVLFIENVGNLICPASFDLGHHLNITLLSVTEGDDKPAKYPVMFRATDLMLISKTDLLAVVDDFDPAKARFYLRQLANSAPVIEVAARRDQVLETWLAWLRDSIAEHRSRFAKQKIGADQINSDAARLLDDPVGSR